jgi:hypothetical protein
MEIVSRKWMQATFLYGSYDQCKRRHAFIQNDWGTWQQLKLKDVFVAATKHNSKMTKSCSASQEILRPLWNPKVHFDRVKKNQIDAQLTLSIFRQPLHVSGVSRLIIRRYNLCIQHLVLILFRWLSVVLDVLFLDDWLFSWMDIQDNRQSYKKTSRTTIT